jgi:hypothetical protein
MERDRPEEAAVAAQDAWEVPWPAAPEGRAYVRDAGPRLRMLRGSPAMSESAPSVERP